MPDKLTSDNPNVKDKDKYLQWVEQELKAALDYRRDYGYSRQWERLWNQYRGNWPDLGSDGNYESLLPVNYMYSFAQVLSASSFYRNPHIHVRPRIQPYASEQQMGMGGGVSEAAQVNEYRRKKAWVVESLDNWLAQELGIKDTFTDLTYDPWLSGIGGVYVGYTPEELDPGYDTTIKPGLPFAKRTPPRDTLVPYGTRTVDSMRWFARRILRSPSDAKEDPRLKGLHAQMNKDNVPDAVQPGEDDIDKLRQDQSATPQDKPIEWWEFHDAKYKTVCDVQLGAGYFFRKPTKDIDQIEGLPYVPLRQARDSRVFWDTPIALLMEPLQQEMNEQKTQIRDLRTTMLIRLLYRGTAIPDEAIEQIMSGFPLVAVDITTGDIDKDIKVLEPKFPHELLALNEMCRQDMRELSGIGRMQMGEVAGGRKTATEIQNVQQGHETRIDKMRDALATCMSRTFRKVNQLLFTHLPTRIVPVIGDDALLTYVKIESGEEVRDEFDVEINAEEMATGSVQEQQQLAQIIGQLGQVPGINVQYLVRELLKRYKTIDVQQAFPAAPGGPQGFQQYAQQGTPDAGAVQKRAGAALQNLGGT